MGISQLDNDRVEKSGWDTYCGILMTGIIASFWLFTGGKIPCYSLILYYNQAMKILFQTDLQVTQTDLQTVQTDFQTKSDGESYGSICKFYY